MFAGTRARGTINNELALLGALLALSPFWGFEINVIATAASQNPRASV
jgi:hypothetical protein